MSAEVFFDTSVLVYAFTNDPGRTPIAQQLLSDGGVISVQVLNEYVAVLRRKQGKEWNEVEQGLAYIRELCPKCLPITLKMHESAVLIAARYKFQIYDGLILAAALMADCSTLYSEDMQHGQQIQGLTIRNPFL